jgi:elongation factor Ts
MNKAELIRELRELTQAGMKDCNDALQEAGYDIQKAIDIIKTKGKNIVSGRSGKVAAEGIVKIINFSTGKVMVEVNCQTDFVANSPEFNSFVDTVADAIRISTLKYKPFDTNLVEKERSELVAKTKENIVVRRWWIEEALLPLVEVASYVHSNKKIGVVLTAIADTDAVYNNPEFPSIMEGLAMQIAAMNPISVSSESIPFEAVARQKAIFETQLKEANKPEATWPKILEGKFNKWYSEVCLLNQESIMIQKKTVKQFLDDLAGRLGGEIKIVNFIRCQVGEGIDKPKEVFADEVTKVCQAQQ